MANDNLRSGPEGATAQASKLGNRIIKLVEVDATAGSGAITHAANTAEAVLATVAGTVAHELVKADGPTAAYGFPGTYDQACFGGEWIVEKIWMQSTANYATNPLANVTAGIYSLKSDGTVTAIDVDALCKAQAVTIAQQQFGMTHELVMDGDGVGLPGLACCPDLQAWDGVLNTRSNTLELRQLTGSVILSGANGQPCIPC